MKRNEKYCGFEAGREIVLGLSSVEVGQDALMLLNVDGGIIFGPLVAIEVMMKLATRLVLLLLLLML